MEPRGGKVLEEIYLHVKKLKEDFGLTKEINKQKANVVMGNINEKIVKETISDNSPNDNLLKIEDLGKSFSKMNIKITGICDLCGQDIIFNENLSGLILQNKFFACEECCIAAKNELLDRWIKNRNAKTEDVKPIAFWLMQEKHKTRLI